MMTIDDEGEGGVWPNYDVITEIQIFWQIFGISQGILLKFFPKFSNSGTNSQVNLRLNQIVSDLLQGMVLNDKPPTLSC